MRTDGEATRQRILQAAGKKFAAIGGYAEASNKEIAQLAEVDLASINYHFGNRAGLYQAALIEAHRLFISRTYLQQLAAKSLTADEKLLALIQEFVQRLIKRPYPWHLQLLAREILAPSSHLQVLFEQEAESKQQFVEELLSEITGIPTNDPAIAPCLLSVAAPYLMLLVSGHLPFGTAQKVAATSQEDLVEHLYTFTLGGLKAVAAEREARLPSTQIK